MNSVSRILGEAMTPHQKRIYKDPAKAVRWAIKHNQRFPEAEPYIVNNPGSAIAYAAVVLKGRWPEVEDTLVRSATLAYFYAKDAIKGRWPEAEETLAKDPVWSQNYLKLYPQAKLEWIMNCWLDWLDL
jgi:hypothetical protein